MSSKVSIFDLFSARSMSCTSTRTVSDETLLRLMRYCMVPSKVLFCPMGVRFLMRDGSSNGKSYTPFTFDWTVMSKLLKFSQVGQKGGKVSPGSKPMSPSPSRKYKLISKEGKGRSAVGGCKVWLRYSK